MSNGDAIGLSLRDLVLEVRDDVKALNRKVDQIDRQGSVGTREELVDHESRLRRLENYKWWLGASTTSAGGIGGAAAGVILAFFG